MNDVLLSVKDLFVSYGNIQAVKGISFDVHEGEIVTLIGANGAGKSSSLRAISGIIPYKGSIAYKGPNLSRISADKIVGMGISQVPEGREVFHDLTVKENLLMGAYLRKDRTAVKGDFEQIYRHFPVLKARENQWAGTLSGGEQQMLAIGRALMTDPELLLLDEPSMGLAPFLVQAIMKIIRKLNEQGTTILLVEQNAKVALKLADYGYVLETGKIVIEGDGATLRQDESIVKAYLGGGHCEAPSP